MFVVLIFRCFLHKISLHVPILLCFCFAGSCCIFHKPPFLNNKPILPTNFIWERKQSGKITWPSIYVFALCGWRVTCVSKIRGRAIQIVKVPSIRPEKSPEKNAHKSGKFSNNHIHKSRNAEKAHR